MVSPFPKESYFHRTHSSYPSGPSWLDENGGSRKPYRPQSQPTSRCLFPLQARYLSTNDQNKEQPGKPNACQVIVPSHFPSRTVPVPKKHNSNAGNKRHFPSTDPNLRTQEIFKRTVTDAQPQGRRHHPTTSSNSRRADSHAPLHPKPWRL